jgi:uncharacterized protein (DUF2267 family)
VASAQISDSLGTADPVNRRGVANQVISALQRSLDDGHNWEVSGTIP